MNNLFKISGILFITALLASCDIREGEDPCPEGDVRIHLYAEKFRNKSDDPLSDREVLFCDRINHIRYYLYHDGMLKDQGIVDTFDDRQIGSYTFRFPNLEYGEYKAIFVGNSTGEALTGDPSDCDNLLITYPGCSDTEDYFTAVFPFSVQTDAPHEYTVGLSRAHGVVRYTFNNLPHDAIAIGVTMENVGKEKWITGDYTNSLHADMRYDVVPLTRQVGEAEDYVMGTFPTGQDQRSTFRLGLYREGEDEPYLSQMISDTLSITRNQLLDIAVTYDDGTFNYEILLDNEWDGSNPGGSGGIQ